MIIIHLTTDDLKGGDTLICTITFLNNIFFALSVMYISINGGINFSGDPLYVGMDLTIASFDAISEVNMVSQ